MEKLRILAFVLADRDMQGKENAGMKRCFYITVFLMHCETMADPEGK